MDTSPPRRLASFAMALTLVLTGLSAGFAPPPAQAQTAGGQKGYWMVAADGGIFAFGDAPFKGSTGNIRLARPIVGMASTPSGQGYWMVASDGGMFAFGDAQFYGSTGNILLNSPIVGMSPTATGQGYWLVAADGGIFSFGDAVFHGSTGDKKLNRPIVGMATTAGGQGYWLVATDGGIFAFGDATFYGSTGDRVLNQPVVGMEPTATGRGYWMTASDGGMFSFGDAAFHGSTGDRRLNRPVVGMAASETGKGYYLVATDGGIFAFGDAEFKGSTGNIRLAQPVVGMAVMGSVTRPPIGFLGHQPVAAADTATTDEDTPVTVDVTANDTILDGPAVVTIATAPANGAATVGVNNVVTYTPAPGFFGTDSFTYAVVDRDQDSATATVTISVTAVNDTPVANDDLVTIPEDTLGTIEPLLNDTGLDDGVASLEITTQPLHGTVTVLPGGKLQYQADLDYNGSDTIEYQVTDADGEVASATITITVEPVNDVPRAINDAYVTATDAVLAVAEAVGTVANDVDVDATADLEATLVAGPTNGTLTVNLAANGSFTYTPNTGFTGVDSFTYTVSDGVATSNTATVTIAVGLPDETPVGVPDVVADAVEDTAKTIDVLANDTGLGDGVARITVTTGAGTHGTVTVNADFTLTYTPDANFNGAATFTYDITDGNGDVSAGNTLVTITVAAVNDLPVGIEDAYSTAEDVALVVNAALGVLRNDFDVDAGAVLTATVVTPPASGTLTLAADGSFTYTPP
ncbi:MAG: Ig-like domain-containing protein, partial [Actinomycetota bacterium]